MLSESSYFLILLSKSLSFSLLEKVEIFDYVKNNPKNLGKIINILEDGQIGMHYIEHDYIKHINIIWKQFNSEINESIRLRKIKNKKLYYKKIKNIRFLESQDREISIKKLNNLINSI